MSHISELGDATVWRDIPTYWTDDDAMSTPVQIPLCHDGEDY